MRRFHLGVVLAAILAVGVWVSLPVPVAGQVPPAIYRGPTDRPAVALACNVVWGTQLVPQILQILAAGGAHATFFVGGAWAAAQPDLVRQMVAAGHEVGNHGYGHRHQQLLSLADNESEMERTQAAVLSAAGVRPTLFAPPYGEHARVIDQAALRLGLRVVYWTVDTVDWKRTRSAATITATVLDRAGPGSIILIHPTDRTVAALPAIIAGLRERGLAVLTVSQLLAGHP